jgi:hypothetical protein
LLQRINYKFGLNIELMFREISVGSMPVIRLNITQYLPGVSPFVMTLDLEQIAHQNAASISLLRTIFLACLFLICPFQELSKH